MIELYCIIIIFVIVLFVIYNKPNNIENFENNYYLRACPSGYKSFYDSDGNLGCCDGQIVANKCIGDNQCTMNGKGNKTMPDCVSFILNDYEQKSKQYCPLSLPSYFEDISKNSKGCTNGLLNDNLNGPKNNTQPTCIIYKSLDENINSKNSCYNQKLLDDFPCFGNNCVKTIIQSNPNIPPLIMVGFTDSNGMYHTSYTRKSMENYLNKTNPNWRNSGINLSKNINITEVAKAFYIDRTLQQSDIEL